MAAHLKEQLSQRNLNNAANLTKLNTRCPPSCNCEFLKQQNLHYVLDWHPCAIVVGVCMHSQCLFTILQKQDVPAKPVMLCVIANRLSTEKISYACRHRNSVVSVICYPVLHLCF